MCFRKSLYRHRRVINNLTQFIRGKRTAKYIIIYNTIINTLIALCTILGIMLCAPLTINVHIIIIVEIIVQPASGDQFKDRHA
jgi:hypothetical protein